MRIVRRFIGMAMMAAFVVSCVHVPAEKLLRQARYSDDTLDASNFTLVSWNIAKESAGDWSHTRKNRTLRARLSRADLLLLQEVCVTSSGVAAGLAPLLRANDYGWVFAASFESALLGCGTDAPTGVLTASRAEPSAVTALRSRHRELGLTPKTTLASTFALDDCAGTLLVINTHLLNFEWLGTDDVADQLARIGERITAHSGPVILAGDLNTRNAKRLSLVRQLAARHGLRAVFDDAPGGRTQSIFGGGFALDHVFYRGLRVVSPGSVGNETTQALSDHNSLTVTFALDAPYCERPARVPETDTGVSWLDISPQEQPI